MVPIRKYVRKIKNVAACLRYDVSFAIFDLRCQWRKHVVLRWYRLWVRKDEFHPSLDTDAFAMCAMTGDEKTAYLNDLARRRNIAHRRDLQENGA